MFGTFLALAAILVLGNTVCLKNDKYTLILRVQGLRNETGHWQKDVKLDFDGPRAPQSWDVDFEETVLTTDHYGFTAVARVLGVTQTSTLVGPKHVYRSDTRNFTDASHACEEIGAQLAVINSKEEAAELRSLVELQRDPRSTHNFTFLGFHDIEKEGTFVTVQGSPLSLSGYFRWALNEPSNSRTQISNGVFVTENCGSMNLEGLLNDSPCHYKMPFICEFPETCDD